MSKNKVLIPLNQSTLSQKILPHVEKFISANENELILFFVTKPPGGSGFGEPDLGAGYVPMPGDKPVKPTLHPIYASQQQDSIKAHVEAELMSVTNRLKEAGYKISIVVDFGKDPVAAILRVITKRKINLVAMSTRARVGVTRFFFRNIADLLAQKAKIPVLLIHPPEQ
ncbi:universal stress protein [Candidatus Spongiihabitans sp.]|uniref:universal stress protein n=1 Tax=Candidatus Spongiihabitans sp. TaxID=3101308 RepID=UPI003C6F3D74